MAMDRYIPFGTKTVLLSIFVLFVEDSFGAEPLILLAWFPKVLATVATPSSHVCFARLPQAIGGWFTINVSLILGSFCWRENVYSRIKTKPIFEGNDLLDATNMILDV